ncbi:MAG: M28 family peptidase [Candidatus Thiodiazotropha sp. (ex Ctena orbiculata)]|nr:M28 family peptidase [Candidatus Thiodiazotropha taylori]MBT2998107.1 M28 family peptidase [Candidatus Thiodiazotropha taylori]MBT3002406.1 M28 family peptidase [Candidatus Thiodiazotropha taylori]MBV2108012.1 M28 family peptidase [Candidatus Thiodiazotropha taylori]MBV2112705.1 M28 family peptidase [Candidatus Thiodiazotropha taylori]
MPMPKGLISAVSLLPLLSLWPLYADSSAKTEARLLSNVRQLTFEGRRAGEGYFNADGSSMIFQSERDDANPFYQIYLMDLETGDVEQVSPGYGKTTCAWIHPTDNKVLYASTHEDTEARSKMQQELDFRASGKERRYSWDYDPNFDIYEQALTSGVRKNLTRTPGYDAEAAYSPDGRQIVFASNRRAYSGEMSEVEKRIFEHDKSFMMDLYLMNADGSELRRLTDSPGYDGGPFFSFDGSRITWRRFSIDGSRAEIYTMDLASGEERQLTQMGVMSWAPFFHPSGDYLIFASNREGFANFELYLVDAQGKGEPVRVTYTDGFDGLPVFSPDGGRLSWTSKRGAGKSSQIYLADWNDANARRLLGLNEREKADRSRVTTADLTTTSAAISSQDLRQHVTHLSSDEMEGRLTGTEGERRATRYIASVFRQLGLKPAGDDGYFQSFSFTAGAKLGEGNGLDFTGLGQGHSLQLEQDWLPLAISRSGRVEPAPIVFAGYGIVAPGLDKVPDYDTYGDLEVKDKWVMMFRFQPESVPPEWRRHMLHYSDLAYKASVAKRRGAIGLIVVTGPNAEVKQQLIELEMEAKNTSSSIAAISISDDLASRILAVADKDLARLQQQLDKGEPMQGFAIPGVELAADLAILREINQGRNVIARLTADVPSARSPVIIGAHLDHLGRGEISGSLAREDERGKVHHGADDNASGVAALLESAQYLVDMKKAGKLGSKRDILFAAWSGEELGTLGSNHFVDQFSGGDMLHGKVSAYLNMDMIGHLREKLYLQGTGSSDSWSREIERRNVPVGLAIATKDDPYLPTDSTPFYMKGVPVLNAFTGAHEDYSSPRDRADQLNYQGMQKIARLMAGITRSLARSESEPDYIEATRKQSGLSRKHLRAYLGTIPTYGQDEDTKGVKLQGAVKGGPAEEAGIQNGDLLIGLAGVEVETIHDFMHALGGLKPGEETEMIVIREGKRLTLRVVPTSRD